jgi:hypothetical protein
LVLFRTCCANVIAEIGERLQKAKMPSQRQLVERPFPDRFPDLWRGMNAARGF